VFLLCYLYIRSKNETLDISSLSGLLLLAIAWGMKLYYKPEMFSTLFFTITVFIYFYAKSYPGKLFFLYPIVFIVWVNLHGGFVAGLMFISIVFAGELLNYFIIKKNRMEKKLLIHLAFAVAASYLATLLNPYGMDYHKSIFEGMFAKEFVTYQDRVFAYKDMWQFVFSKSYGIHYRIISAGWSMVIMAILFLTLSAYAYRKRRQFDMAIHLANGFFFFAGMATRRYALFFPLVAFLSVLYILKNGNELFPKKKIAPFTLLFFLFCAGNILYVTLFFSPTKSWFGVNIEQFTPAKTVSFIQKYKIEPPFFNDYLVGGYMIWAMYPEYRVFIDPRYGPYWKQVNPDYFNFTRNPNTGALRQLSSKYPFKAALINLRDVLLIYCFLETGEWKPLFSDHIAVLFVHQSHIPSLSPDALATDVSPYRFKDIAHPGILTDLFIFWVNIHPQFGRVILDIYRQNVSGLYRHRQRNIRAMESAIKETEMKLRQRQLQQAAPK
jgi:hypothetical protein